ncbi:interferon gamma receptor 2 [Patagioenas fasciata monilis]|uniref:Interferon gamma receptor 2 n=1 Tax=Patagioenas fasciata monilis TaxID=372326 RepID=A0A1V4J2E7_PATFA|nr:interferon gamma receptor 2 [Patagioenas fasciata monilis]
MPCRAPLLSLVLLSLLFFLLVGSVRASGTESFLRLPAPKNVTVYSYNFHSLLRWSPVEVNRGLVLYTVHFKTGFLNEWDEMNCTRITQTECNISWSLRKRRWTVFLRVRAELGQATSDWVETDPFVAERNTTIGPPKVNSVTESSDSLLIRVTPPFGSEAGYFPEYYVSYWENATSTIKREIKLSNTLFKIENLKELTLYCFSIQVVLKVYPDLQLLGLPSVPECYRTTVSEATKAGYLSLILISVLLFVTLATVGLFHLWRHRKAIKYWFQPPLEIPSHFEEYLKDPSVPALEELDNHPEDDPHDSLSVISHGDGSQASGSSLDGQARSHSISSDSEVT